MQAAQAQNDKSPGCTTRLWICAVQICSNPAPAQASAQDLATFRATPAEYDLLDLATLAHDSPKEQLPMPCLGGRLEGLPRRQSA